MPETAEPEQVLAFRLAGHHLHRRTDPLTAVAACGLQDTAFAGAEIALHARSTGTPDPEDVLTVHAMRGAPWLVPKADVRVFTEALLPEDEAGLKAFVGGATPRDLAGSSMTLREALDRVAAATRETLAGGALSRDDFHQGLRERLPAGPLLPWCRGCGSHHVRSSLWRAMGPLGLTQIPAGGTLAAAPRARAYRHPADELVRRFLRAYGPATHTQLADWAQQSPARAKAMMSAIGDELVEVRFRGQARRLLAEDTEALARPPKACGVRLPTGYDPYADMRDRELLVPDAALRKRMFRPTSRLGLVLVDGSLAGTWSARKKGDTLVIGVDWLGDEADLTEEATAIARLRGCAQPQLT